MISVENRKIFPPLLIASADGLFLGIGYLSPKSRMTGLPDGQKKFYDRFSRLDITGMRRTDSTRRQRPRYARV